MSNREDFAVNIARKAIELANRGKAEAAPAGEPLVSRYEVEGFKIERVTSRGSAVHQDIISVVLDGREVFRAAIGPHGVDSDEGLSVLITSHGEWRKRFLDL